MIRWEHRYLGRERFPETLSALETEQFFTLSDAELKAVQERRGMPNRQGLALQIGFLKMTGSTLNSVELIPAVVLEAIGRQLGSITPIIASIRAFYRRRRTLFDHQAAALKALGRTELGHAERGLVAYLRREAASVFELSDLMDRARSWMVDHDYLLLREKDIRRIAYAARRYQDDILFTSIETAVKSKRDLWVRSLLSPVAETTTSHLEWLGTVSSSKAFKGLEDQVDKVHYLKELGADRLVLPDLPIIGLEYFARRMLARKPSALSRIREPQRTIEIACFLRLTLLRLTDSSLTLVDHQIAAFWRGARERAEASGATRLRRFRELLGNLVLLAEDEALDAGDLRSRLRGLLGPFESERLTTQVAAIRQELGNDSAELGRLLKIVRTIKLTVPIDHKLASALATLDAHAAEKRTELAIGTPQPFGPSWQRLIDQHDRAAALGCFRAATVMALKRALRNRSVTVEHSFSHRAPEDKMIPLKLWQRDRGRFIRGLGLPASSEKFFERQEAALTAGLAALAEATEAGVVAIERGEIRIPRRKPMPPDPQVGDAHQVLMQSIVNTQLPQILIEIDVLTRFSWVLLRRPARSEHELVTLYAALLGLGSDMSAAELARMVPPLAADSIGQMMLKIETEGRLREANDTVLRFMRQHRIASLWGRGLFASADMMSLEATRYLWSARLDPRRRTYAIGTYAHVLDQWGILYDQPIVLNRRQAGAAIEGALRQGQVDGLERVAVDTHGFTHFGMALGKGTSLDLCPRLAGLKNRKLYLPKGLDVPETLRPLVVESVSRHTVRKGWDGFLRLCASVKNGWYPATEVLDRFGSAAKGDPVYETGDSIGKLLRTLYLCDYLSNPEFRTGILDLLNQGEAVHSLQRAIHNGMITAKRGRNVEQLGAISGSLSLLANIIMAWNTHRFQATIDLSPGNFPDEVQRRLAPIGHKHINMRGILTFDLGRHRAGLLDRAAFDNRGFGSP